MRTLLKIKYKILSIWTKVQCKFIGYRIGKCVVANDDSLSGEVGYIRLAEGQRGVYGLPTNQLEDKLGNLKVDLETMEMTFQRTGDALKLDPRSKALYILFLRHPFGIKRESIVEHVTELKDLYRRTSNRDNLAQQRLYIEQLFYQRNKANLRKAISRCNTQIKKNIPDKQLQGCYTINTLSNGLVAVPIARYNDLIFINNN